MITLSNFTTDYRLVALNFETLLVILLLSSTG